MKYLILVLGFFVSVFGGYHSLCAIQHKGYNNSEYLCGITKLLRMDLIGFILSSVIALIMYYTVQSSEYLPLSVMLAILPPMGLIVIKAVRFPSVLFKFSARAKRLFAIYACLCVLYAVFCGFFTFALRSYGSFCSMTLLLTLVANSIAYPFEKRKNEGFKSKAQQKLQRVSPLIIAVTGSAGKTTVKELLKALLSENRKVYATPESYNTPMGISRAIVQMPVDTQVFIVEFGARHKGDIKELCDFVNPSVGVLTSVLPQHLETFGSIEQVFREKSLLLRRCKQRFCSSSVCRSYNEIWEKGRAVSDFGIARENLLPNDTVVFGIEDIEGLLSDLSGISFDYKLDTGAIHFSSTLLGKSNVDNITLALGIAFCLGCSTEYAVRTVGRFVGPPHRMNSFSTSNGVLVIDDSYNINPQGAKTSLELLKTAKGRRIAACSGFVELNREGGAHLKMLCEQLIDCTDMVIVIGEKNKTTLCNNLEGKVKYLYAKDIDECKRIYTQVLRKGDTLLIMADIPAEYNF